MEMLEVKVNDAQHDEDGCRGKHGDRLPQGPKESMIELRILALCHQCPERRRLGAEPGDGHRLKGVCEAEGHSHLTGGNSASIREQHRIKELIDKISAKPADGDAPLKGPHLIPPMDAILAGV